MWRSRFPQALSALIPGRTLGWSWSWSERTGAGAGLPSLSAQAANPLPADRNQQMVSGRCIICHSLEMIAQQHETRDEWAAIVDRMISHGMPVGPGDKERILAYLTKHLGQ